jgi:hypothetical protein
VKLQEIAERLQTEFPDRYVSFIMDASTHVSTGKSFTNTSCQIYTQATGHIKCGNLEEGIAKVKERLTIAPPPNIDIEPSVEAAPPAPEPPPEPRDDRSKAEIEADRDPVRKAQLRSQEP